MSTMITTVKKRRIMIGPEHENKHSRLLIDNLVVFSADCKEFLKDRLFVDLNSSKMVSLLFNELDHVRGQIFVNTSSLLMEEEKDEEDDHCGGFT